MDEIENAKKIKSHHARLGEWFVKLLLNKYVVERVKERDSESNDNPSMAYTAEQQCRKIL